MTTAAQNWRLGHTGKNRVVLLSEWSAFLKTHAVIKGKPLDEFFNALVLSALEVLNQIFLNHKSEPGTC